jgi:CheY-like chemotaxis protein
MYSIVVICPAEHARAAIRQHIEQVVPHQIAVNVTAVADIGTFSALVSGPTSTSFTHIVLDLPHSSDIMLFMRQMTQFTATVIPSLVVITDHYQKRDILEDFNRLIAAGRRAYLVHKPVKPSVFAMIFDPAQLRYLSKDRVRHMAQTSSDDFKNIAETVKRTVGNRAFRLLLVEDSDVNRMVIMRYLKKVELACDEATNGLEATDKVLARPHGYYSLIICDIQMPRKNGYETCAEIRAWEKSHGHPPIPIMALTANAMPEEKAAAGQAGFTDYLTKPVDFNVLGPMMIKLLDSRVPHVLLKDRPAESG